MKHNSGKVGFSTGGKFYRAKILRYRVTVSRAQLDRENTRARGRGKVQPATAREVCGP